MQNKWLRRFWFIPPVVIALLILLAAPKLKRPPQQVEAVEHATKVRVIKAPAMAFAPKAVGYGKTSAARTWEAVAEVSGQVSRLADELKSGKIVARGVELLRIDDTGYQLALTQAETRLNALAVKDKATRASLALEERGQSLLGNEVERKRRLQQQGTLSASALEEAERLLLKGEMSIQGLKNTLAMDEAERKVLNTQKANAELDLQRTRFVAPFDVRITDIKINQAQYANKGQLLFSADGLDAVEVEARFPIGRLRPLIGGGGRVQKDQPVPVTDRAPGALRLAAVVRLKTATRSIEWPARVDRVAGVIDPQTQTIGVVVVVDKPYEMARPGQRPPLIRNTFVEVELRKKGKGKVVVVPTSALHDGKIYIVNREKRLEIRLLKTRFVQGGIAAIAKGLEAGESIVVSDLIPAAVGMLLDPMEDKKAMKRLRRGVGEGRSKGRGK